MKMEKLNKTDFNKMMNQRKKLIPEWTSLGQKININSSGWDSFNKKD